MKYISIRMQMFFSGLNKYKFAYIFYDCIESQTTTAMGVEVEV